jgi:hypothetical protein
MEKDGFFALADKNEITRLAESLMEGLQRKMCFNRRNAKRRREYCCGILGHEIRN